MANCVQQITWQLKRADLEALLKESGTSYTALQFKMCIDEKAKTIYYVSLVSDAANGSKDGSEFEACPLPPGCD